jgi:predicted negative regulator of RcsB-dependent stress response
MANFFSASQEEQQEILLTIWERFKYLIILTFISVILLIGGRDYFLSSSNEKDYAIASIYQSYLESNDAEIGEQILSIYPNSVYSDFVRLNEAKRSFEAENADEAILLLQSIISNNPSSVEDFNPLQAAAKTRLAKIYLENNNYNEVISMLTNTDELTATMLEMKGDAENGLGQFSAARTNYLLALQKSNNQSSRALISMKISDLEGDEIE